MSRDVRQWATAAKQAAWEHDRREQEADEQEAEQTVDYVLRLAERLGVRETAGTARLGERTEVDGDQVTYWLPADDHAPPTQLRATVSRDKPEVHAWVHFPGINEPVDCGPVETLVDLGRALDPAYVPAAAEQAAEATAGDLLLQVLHALVRDVVSEALDDRDRLAPKRKGKAGGKA